MFVQEKVSFKRVISFGGAFIALIIGSGFATGQELMQYFSAYGKMGALSLVLVFALFYMVGTELIITGYEKHFENPNDIYTEVGGKFVGKFYDYFSVFFLFLSYTVMIAGAQATAMEQYNSPKYVGGIVLAVFVMLTVYFGLDRIVDIIGSIGPVIVILAIGVGTVSFILNFKNIPNAAGDLEMALNSGDLHVASTNPILAAGSYVGFNLIWLAGFLSSIGKELNSKKEGRLSIFTGAFGFSVASFLVSLAIYISISKVYSSQIPMLMLARDIHPTLAHIFSIVIFFGIYTSAVPLLWNVVARFSEDGTKRYKMLTIILGIIGAIIGLTIHFNKLVNVVYVVNGYIGLVFGILLIIRHIKRKFNA